MYISLIIDKYAALTLFYIFNDAQDRRGERSPSLLALLLFGIFWNILKP